jgi:hypothetical protein
MDYKKELEKLLETLKKNHFDTVHKLSGLYTQAEETITSLKDKSDKEIEDGLLYVKKLICEAADIKNVEVDGFRNNLNNFFTEIVEKLPSDAKSKADDIASTIDAFQIKDEDAKKITEIATGNMQTMFTVFSRMGEIFTNHFGDKENKKEE